MFILKDTGRNKINRMFRNWLTDLLLIFHFLIIVFLALSLAQPYINVPQSMLVQDSILVIDVSASTKINNRIDDIKDKALDSLSERNTIILAQGFPEVIADQANAARARRLIKQLEAKDTTTNLADALKLANQYSGPNTNVVVISDFLPSAGALDIIPQLDAIESKGAVVITHEIGKAVANVGLIDLTVRDTKSRIWVKNYGDTPAEVTVKIGDAEENVLLAKRETKELSFQTPEGLTEITIKEKDAFMTDNTVWLSTPEDNQIDILVFTNEQESFEASKLMIAFGLIEKNFPITIKIEYAIPPKVPDLNHDIYLFYKVRPDFLLPGHIEGIRERVEKGAALIVMAQNGLFAIDFKGLLPVNYVADGSSAEVSAPEENLLTKDIDFGQVQHYFRVTKNEGITVVAQAGEDPIITLNKLGKGTIMYYGYLEDSESFSNENSFPVFWRRIIDLATNRPTLHSLNVKTGTLLTFPKEIKVKTPTKKIVTNLLRVEDAGLYVFEDRTIAANLLSDLESNTNRASALEKEGDGEAESTENKLPKELSQIFIILGLIILLLELIYIKLRGDL